MKLIYTYFFQYTYILFNNESMLYTYMYLYVIIPTHVFFFLISKTKIFFTFAGQHVFWVLLGYH